MGRRAIILVIWSLYRKHHGLTADFLVAKDPNTNQIMDIKNQQDKELSI